MIRLITFVFFTLTFMQSSHAFDAGQYYRLDEVDQMTSGQMQGRDLKAFLSRVSARDFHALGYKRGSKPALFGFVDLERDEEGYFVKDVYCNIKVRHRVGPNRIPNNNVMNTEHTWPQSKGSKREPARGDLHHLFPTNSKANSTRGNFPFGEVEGEPVGHNCTASKVGDMINPFTGKSSGRRAYQPPAEHRGNVARAMFYAAARYGYRISDAEEYYLRKWHWDDPVDANEIRRNDEISEVQGNRNPFIDFPELIERIDNL